MKANDAMRPFFDAPLSGDAPSRRLLLVSHTFPPDGSVGALRWQKLAAAAFARGWGIDVIMMDPAESALRDDSRLRELPPGTRLYGVPTRTPWLEHWQRRAIRLRNRLADARASSSAVSAAASRAGARAEPLAGSIDTRWAALKRQHLARLFFRRWNDWAARSARIGACLARERSYGLVVSSGPPHLAHICAQRVARAAGLPHVIDLRDPWFSEETEPDDMRSALWRERTHALERAAVSEAALVVVNTESCRRMMAARYPERADRFLTVMNGADRDVNGGGALDPRFTIAHAGTLYSGRDPRILFRGVEAAVRELGATPQQLIVRFMGDAAYRSVPLMEIARESGIADFFEALPLRPRSEALEMLGAAAMVVVLPQQHVHSIPGKVFEYVQLPAWLLVLAETGTATELLLRDSGADVVRPDDAEGLRRVIVRRYRERCAGARPRPINADGRFDRARQAALLLDALERFASASGV
jgi:hypothetical protein